MSRPVQQRAGRAASASPPRLAAFACVGLGSAPSRSG